MAVTSKNTSNAQKLSLAIVHLTYKRAVILHGDFLLQHISTAVQWSLYVCYCVMHAIPETLYYAKYIALT